MREIVSEGGRERKCRRGREGVRLKESVIGRERHIKVKKEGKGEE